METALRSLRVWVFEHKIKRLQRPQYTTPEHGRLYPELLAILIDILGHQTVFDAAKCESEVDTAITLTESTPGKIRTASDFFVWKKNERHANIRTSNTVQAQN